MENIKSEYQKPEKERKKKSNKWLFAIIGILAIALIVIGVIQGLQYINQREVTAYQQGAIDGITYRNSMIASDLQKQGYTQMIISDGQRNATITLVPYNPQSGAQA